MGWELWDRQPTDAKNKLLRWCKKLYIGVGIKGALGGKELGSSLSEIGDPPANMVNFIPMVQSLLSEETKFGWFGLGYNGQKKIMNKNERSVCGDV